MNTRNKQMQCTLFLIIMIDSRRSWTITLILSCAMTGIASALPGGQRILYNPEAVVPPQCYTRTESQYNPCYVCHQDYARGEGRSNYLDDGYLQGDYNFSDVARQNHWRNLFVDRRAQINTISDTQIQHYIEQDNYSPLVARLEPIDFKGYIPDLENLQKGADAFDTHGFALDGSGWVAFHYKPFPSTFWPTNGSTDDVMIRLPPNFRTTAAGSSSTLIYQLNLAVMESAIKNMALVPAGRIDEREIGFDLNDDGELGVIHDFPRPDHYLGGAEETPVISFLYPQGTEFLHSVRYLGVDEKQMIYPAPRMKELRYMRKAQFLPVHVIGSLYADEQLEKEQNMLPYYADLGDQGISNGFGWYVQGFIEDQDGALRPQSYEETLFCMGCHTSVGATIDQTFAFPRKLTGEKGWGYLNLHGMPDAPAKGESTGEILLYLSRVGGGDEFRQNEEMLERWFTPDGQIKNKQIRQSDVYTLITPSATRAYALNKAYRLIVMEQSFIHGRDATIAPATNVYEYVTPEQTSPLPQTLRSTTDIRLDWPR